MELTWVANADGPSYTATITGYTGDSPVSLIADTESVETYSVYLNMTVTHTYTFTRVASDAFLNCTTLTSVNIPHAIIIDGAFKGCTNLTDVNMPLVTSINYAFYNCSSLTSVNMPNVTSISSNTFQGCTSLTGVTFSQHLTYIGNNAFKSCNVLTYVDIAEVTVIGTNAFEGCSILDNVNISSVTDIESNAFSTSGITSITIPSSITSIGNRVFASSSLTSITLPSSVTYIGDGAFQGCTSLTSVNIPNATGIGTGAFEYCSLLTDVSLPLVTDVSESAFRMCSALLTITLPAAINLETNAIVQCNSLTSISLPNAINIVGFPWASNPKLESLDIPSVTQINQYMFIGLEKLKSVNISSVTDIGSNIFTSKSFLENVTMPNVTGIDEEAFSYCTSLTSVNIPNVTHIYDRAFYQCNNLISIYTNTDYNNISISNVSTFTTNNVIIRTTGQGWPATIQLGGVTLNVINNTAVVAVAAGPNEIGAYIVASSASTPTLMTEMRSALTTLGGSDAQKAAAKVEYIAAMNAKVGGDAISILEAECASLVATLTSQKPNIPAKPIAAFFPDIINNSATIDVTSVQSSNYLFIESAVGDSITLQNGVESKTLLFTGASCTSEGVTYGLLDTFTLSNTEYTIDGFGSLFFGVNNGGGGGGGGGGGELPCFPTGTKILTAAGYKAVETLASSDKIVTADGRTVAFNLYSTHVKSATKETAPYLIPANTFGSKSPVADLTLSPLHAIQSRKGVWQIPKYAALTHSAIHQVCLGEQVTYYHVELPNFFTDNIVAEGTVVESYGLKQTKGMTNVYKFNTSLNGFTRISNNTTKYNTK